MKNSMRHAGTAAVLDVETTGFSPYREEIIELAVTVFRYDRAKGRVLEIVSEYSGLREPTCGIPRAATEVHGMTRPMLRGLDLDHRRVREMLREVDFIVAHCAAFDRSFVCRLIPSLRKKTWLCSRDGIDWRAKGYTDRSLGELATAHKIENPRAHRASGDVAALLALLSFRPRNRRSYLFELLRNAGLLLPNAEQQQ